MGQRPEDLKDEDELLASKIKTENMGDGSVLFPSGTFSRKIEFTGLVAIIVVVVSQVYVYSKATKVY